jgi:hypothetical protein
VLTAAITLMLEAVSSTVMSISIYQTTRRNIPEDSYIHIRRRENLKFHVSRSCSCLVDVWRNEIKSPRIHLSTVLEVHGQLHTWARLSSEITHRICRRGHWLDPRESLDAVAKRKILVPARTRTQVTQPRGVYRYDCISYKDKSPTQVIRMGTTSLALKRLDLLSKKELLPNRYSK